MYSKNIILYFCVALYFLQCQGNEVHRQKIQEIVSKHYKEGSFGYKKFIFVINEVKKATGASGEFPSRDVVEKLFEGHVFLAQVLSITQVMNSDYEIMKLVCDAFKTKELIPYGLNFGDVHDIIIKTRKAKRLNTSIDEKIELQKEILEHMFNALNKDQIIDIIYKNIVF